MQDSPARDRFPAEARQGLRGALTPAAAFIALAVIYAVMVRGRVDWMAAISGAAVGRGSAVPRQLFSPSPP